MQEFIKNNGIKAAHLACKIGVTPGFFNNALKGRKKFSNDQKALLKKYLLELKKQIEIQIKNI